LTNGGPDAQGLRPTSGPAGRPAKTGYTGSCGSRVRIRQRLLGVGRRTDHARGLPWGAGVGKNELDVPVVVELEAEAVRPQQGDAALAQALLGPPLGPGPGRLLHAAHQVVDEQAELADAVAVHDHLGQG